jgi:hypothetical protein
MELHHDTPAPEHLAAGALDREAQQADHHPFPDIRQLRKELDEAIRLVLAGRAEIAQMRAAADAEKVETARLRARADAMLARR